MRRTSEGQAREQAGIESPAVDTLRVLEVVQQQLQEKAEAPAVEMQ